MSSVSPPYHPFASLRAFDERDAQLLNAVIEAPKGSRNKFDFDPQRGLFYLGGVLPAGSVFPFDFGFVPATLGEDGDPLDIVVLTDEGSQAFAGCLVAVRLLGALEAEQGKKGEKMLRNDRLIGAAAKSRTYGEARSLDDVPGQIVQDIEHFFCSYNVAKGVEFKPLGRCGPQRARELVEEGQKKNGRG
jgi:inorganic pyrophosphatase